MMRQRAFLLLECMIYLIVVALVLQGVFSFILMQAQFNKKLARALATECALHNALVVFKRDGATMPQAVARYKSLASNKIVWYTSTGSTISWYVDHQRLMRAQSHPNGSEYVVVLEPIVAQFVPVIAQGNVLAITLNLSHNDRHEQIIIWIHNT